MRRAPLVLSATAIALAVLLTFRTHALAASTATPAAVHTNASSSSGSSVPSVSSGSNATGSSTTGSTTTVPSSSATSVSGTATGTAEDTRYGVVQVRVSVSSGRITDVTAVELTAVDIHSEQINAQAVPELRRQVLSAQSAQIDGVSGATFTSQGYEASLQSALDKIGFKG